ncbi:MAG TPA: autotransporter domain-containing protein, partial [Rhizomicrobium sp.]|nr:autotransporter domain-containing protein [Rhizomicrobium sp.]
GTFDISASSAGVSIANLAGSGTVVLGARTLALTNASGSFDGTIGGTGGIAVNAGSFTLTASNSYTGTTTIASGATLALSGSGAIAGSSVTDNGTFDVSAASGNISLASLAGSGSLALGTNSLTLTAAAGTFSGVIAGSGGLTVNGGTETLSGVNTYTGATSIASGATLALSGAGSIAASSGVADSGTFDISASSAGVSIKTLSGGGAVKLGSNTLTLTNAAGTFSGVISGSGGLTLGAGTETLSGANTYTGATTVNAGALTVMGSLAGPVTVAGGKLNGTGTVGAINVTSGTLAPGDAIGTLHANGNVALGNGTTFASEVSPSAADELVATGNVTIGSATTLAITQDAGTYSAHDYTLISAASVSGTFTTVTGASFTGLNSTIQYSATAVDLILTAPSSSSSSSPPPPPGSPPTITFLFGTFGQTPNQIAAGNAVTASPSNATLYTTLGAVVTSGASAMPAALAQLSGDIHASLRSALVEDGKIIRDTVINHAIAGGDGVTVWAAGFGAYGSIDSDGNAAAVHHNDSGVILGADVPVAEGFNLGGGFAFTSQHANLPTETASATGSTNHVIGYANWTDQTWAASLGVDYGWGSNRVTRQITSFSETDSDHQSNGLTQIFGEVGYRIPADTFDLMALEPYVNLADVSARTGAFTETGGVAALDGGAKSASENYLTVGVRAAAPSWSVGDLGVVPNLNVGWQHAFTRFLPSQTLTFAETSQSFTVLGVPLGTDAATIQAGLDISLSPATILSIGYDGEISNRAEDHAVRAELSWKF